jgi:hypothetical protein
MQLTKQQKIYAAVLLLAGAAFAVDRWVIGHGPEEASASTAKARTSAAQPAPAVTPGASNVAAYPRGTISVAPSTAGPRQGPSRSLAVRFQEVVKFERLDLSSVPDAFRPSRRWDPPDAPPVTPVAPPPPRFDLAAQFKSRHKLNAVIASGAGVALVGGKWYSVGQQLDGLTLVAVTRHAAVFKGPGATPDAPLEVELVIDKPPLDMHLQQ